MQNNRNYGYNRYQQSPTSSRNDWNRDTNWSAPDESWRDAERQARGDIASPLPYDTWKQRNPDPPRRNEPDFRNGGNFQYGRDRAPNTVDEQFLVRMGAKRLNNGNLVDRDGYTLRTRDPECSAPSPPSFNPRTQFRKEKSPELGVLSPEELDKRAKQQIQMMKKMEKDEERKKRRRMKEEAEGQDEYEEVTPETVREAPKVQSPPNFLQKPTQESPKPRKFTPMVTTPKVSTTDDKWYSEYKKRVEELKEQVYKSPAQPSTSTGYSSPTGYFFPSVPSGSMTPQRPQKPPQMDLPPPGIIPDSYFPTRRPEIPPYQPPENLGNIDAFGVRIGSKPVVVEDSSDSEEDEALTKLRDIIKNYGNGRT